MSFDYSLVGITYIINWPPARPEVPELPVLRSESLLFGCDHPDVC